MHQLEMGLLAGADWGVGCARRAAHWEEKRTKGGVGNRLCPHPVVELTQLEKLGASGEEKKREWGDI